MNYYKMVTISFHKYDGSGKFWALKQMQLAHAAIQDQIGNTFYKLMGSGGRKGFSIWPDFSTYCLLVEWNDHELKTQFFQQNDYWLEVTDRATEYLTLTLEPIKCRGTWSDYQPFQDTVDLDEKCPFVVLTRATIKPLMVPYFWTKVPRASENIQNYKGHIFSKGVGEWPLFMQATVSIWQDRTAMVAYAYESKEHQEMMKLTREKKWYSEEMFAEFNLMRSEGNWTGLNLPSTS